MTVSIELVTMIVTVATTLLGLAAGFGWMITRTDTRFEMFEQRMDARFEKFEQRMDARFEKVEQRMDARFEKVDVELGEVKIAIARLEGPAPRLVVAR
ncbi:response regulator [Microbacterium sp. CFBP9023]|uniref:response regulator n=1 Tax=Microbacterium sp. CFBP9023 TaxID=3096535 RepID=UPI002A6A289A|nr:response regulator [Microbacterium sp. CFBP9023]MDY0983847.1 response regulator [Microbacterium sp. CFBP9023]